MVVEQRIGLVLTTKWSAPQITGGGMVHEVPQDLENGLLHAPHRIHTGVVPHFEIRPDVIDFHRTKIYPRTTAADAPGPLVSQTTRTRPFRMDAKLVDSHAFMLRVQRWQRACNYSPDIMPEVPPWWEVLGLGSGMFLIVHSSGSEHRVTLFVVWVPASQKNAPRWMGNPT